MLRAISIYERRKASDSGWAQYFWSWVDSAAGAEPLAHDIEAALRRGDLSELVAERANCDPEGWISLLRRLAKVAERSSAQVSRPLAFTAVLHNKFTT